MRGRMIVMLAAAALLVVAVAPAVSATDDRLECESGRALWLLHNPQAGPADQDVTPVGTVFGEAGDHARAANRGPLVHEEASGRGGVAYYTASGPDGQVLWADDTLGGPVYVDGGVCIAPGPGPAPEPEPEMGPAPQRPAPVGDPIDPGRCPGCLQPPDRSDDGRRFSIA